MWKYLEYVKNSGVNSSLFKHLEQHFLASLTHHIKLSWVPQLGQLQWPQQNVYVLAEEMDCSQPANMAVAASPYTECVCENECGTLYVTLHVFAWHQFSFFTCSGVSRGIPAVTSQGLSGIPRAQALVRSILCDVGLLLSDRSSRWLCAPRAGRPKQLCGTGSGRRCSCCCCSYHTVKPCSKTSSDGQGALNPEPRAAAVTAQQCPLAHTRGCKVLNWT